jgi:hypothetical protein
MPMMVKSLIPLCWRTQAKKRSTPILHPLVKAGLVSQIAIYQSYDFADTHAAIEQQGHHLQAYDVVLNPTPHHYQVANRHTGLSTCVVRISLVEWDAQMVHFCQPHRTSKVLNQP